MERSFAREVELLRLGAGEVFHGEGILAITKGLLQAGVSYVGGYQGAPVSHLLDVMVQARPLMDELGVKVEACSNEASAAALLGASIHYPVRGAVTWKSIVGTNVASDAVSNLSSPGVTGGALIIVGEDYGEGASVIQERSLAFALKSTLCLFDPRPDHGRMVDMVEKAFELSEASNMPAMMQLRIRACHVRGTFVCRDNVAPAISQKHPFDEPAGFDYAKLPHPPATFRQEKLKGEARIGAARAFIVEHALNDLVEPGDASAPTAGIGVIVQGGLYNTLMGALVQCGLADAFGDCDVAMLVLNVTCPLAPQQIEAFCRERTAVVVVEEGQPEFIEQEIATILRRAGIATALHGKDVLPQAGEYNVEIVAAGLARVVAQHANTHDLSAVDTWLHDNVARRDAVAARFSEGLPTRPPGFCIGCPERPVFSALKQVQERIGRVHVAADIGCHSFATFEPFSSGHTILGYGMSLASAGGVGPMMTRRSIAIMGDGGFWHNGLLSGVQSALFNKDDTVLLILKNGYTSATGTQEIISTPDHDLQSSEVSRVKPRGNVPWQQLTADNNAIEDTLTGMGVQWLRTRLHLRRRRDDEDADRGVHHRGAGPEGDRRRRRMPARTSAPDQARAGRATEGGQAHAARQVRRRREHVFRRPLVHPAVGMPDADVEGLGRSVEGRPGRDDHRRLRRLRALRLQRARGHVVPVVLSHRGHSEPDALGSTAVVDDDQSRGAGGRMNARTLQSFEPQVDASRRASSPITILIAALGGEGGGVLTQWIVEAAEHAGYPVQSTSIPGVAQRTGATTYYVEIFPQPATLLGGRRPVFNLAPVAGRVDLLVASELLEAVRSTQAGFVDHARTMVVTSTTRTLTNREKIAMGDGREDDARLLDVLVEQSRRHVAFDMNDEARQARTVISAVMFGAVAGSGLLPFDHSHCEAAIRASGKGVDASLAGFERGFARTTRVQAVATGPASIAAPSTTPAPDWPADVRTMIDHGVERLVDYQDARYAARYLERLRPVLALEDRLDPTGAHGHALTRETARFLALWMAFDDVIRVADLKTRADRYARIRAEVGAKPGDLVTVHDYFKPRVAEIAGALPARWSAWLLAWDARRTRRGKPSLAFPLALRSDSRVGHLALRIAASLRRFRPASQRYASEQAVIERWLAALETVSNAGWDAAYALALCGRLIKGYGDTHARGHANLARILDTLTSASAVVKLAASNALASAIDSARDAALADPDGKALDRDIARHGAAPRAIVARPLVFVRPKRMS